MNRLKIAYVIDFIYSGEAGTEKQLLGIIERLDKSRFEPFLIFLKDTEWIRSNPLPCDFYVLNFKGFIKRNIFQQLRMFRKLLKEKKFDILQTFFVDAIFFSFMGTFGECRPKILLSSRRDIGLSKQPWYYKIFKFAMPFVNLRFDGIVANGENTKKHVSKHEWVPAEKIKVIFNGLEMPSERTGPIPEIYRKHSPDVWIGIVANMNLVKRLDVLMRAMAIVRQDPRTMNFKVVHLGHGPEEDSIKSLTRKLGLENDIIFEGSVKNVSAHLGQWDIGVLCSDREGLSNSILEYMSHSLPVVATAVGGNPELVDASNGISSPPGDPEMLAMAIKTLIVDSGLRKRMGRISLEKIKGKYSWDRSITEWRDYYQNILSEN